MLDVVELEALLRELTANTSIENHVLERTAWLGLNWSLHLARRCSHWLLSDGIRQQLVCHLFRRSDFSFARTAIDRTCQCNY